jgi:cation diffusion facilitator CzcD-associated flavoprotein CzcO
MSRACDVAVVGAGPQGLAAVSHLRAHGVETRVFGEPMEFWRRHMPSGMMLRSSWRASHIADPERALTLDAFQATRDGAIPDPIPLGDFIAYGDWYQGRVADDVDRRRVVSVARVNGAFCVRLEDGEEVPALRVVVAAGARAFAWRPSTLLSAPEELVSHTADHSDFARFAGKRVVVLGRGQSAVESAVLLDEAAASVELVFRAKRLNWLPEQPREPKGATAIVAAARYAPTDVGPFGLNWIAAAPDVYARLPRRVRRNILAQATAPAAAAWLRPRLGSVSVVPGKVVVDVVPSGTGVEVRFDDDSRSLADHVLLGTGYQVDLARYGFLSEEFRLAIAVEDGFPRLSYGLESSVPGLHFLGFSAAGSFGPVMRFVVGAEYAARSLLRRVLGKPPSVLDFSW